MKRTSEVSRPAINVNLRSWGRFAKTPLIVALGASMLRRSKLGQCKDATGRAVGTCRDVNLGSANRENQLSVAMINQIRTGCRLESCDDIGRQVESKLKAV